MHPSDHIETAAQALADAYYAALRYGNTALAEQLRKQHDALVAIIE